jgi:hypothetical protein
MQQSALLPRIMPNQKAGQASASSGLVVKASELSRLRVWIFAYFFLWVFEGVLRKWVLPSLSNPLLVIRDPVVIYIYYLAYRMKIFPRTLWVVGSFILTAYMAIIGMAVLGNAAVTLYGWRTDFLHFPLIWVIAVAFGEREMRLIERNVLLLSPLMAILMVLQFVAPSSSWLNVGASEGMEQIGSALGHVRPAATVSFATGPVYFFALLSTFLINSQLTPKRYSLPLVIIALFSTMAASAVCGSRAMIAYMGIVLLVAIITGSVLAPSLILKRPQLIMRWLGALTLMGLTVGILWNVPVIQSGIEAFQVRISNAGQFEGGAQGFADRYFGGMLRFIPVLSEAPPLGYGLGLGTNVGAVLTTGEAQFTLGEDEWSRHIAESGPVFGLAFILWRIGLVLWLLKKSVYCAVRAEPLPLLFFAAVGLPLLSGNIGQATTLGYVVFTSGLCLAAVRIKEANLREASSRRGKPSMTPTASPAMARGVR